MHGLIHVLIRLCKACGLPEWAALFVIVPIYLAAGMGAIMVRRKYFRILKRKVAPYDGSLRQGLIFWAPAAHFTVEGVPGILPWCSLLGTTLVRFQRLPAAGKGPA